MTTEILTPAERCEKRRLRKFGSSMYYATAYSREQGRDTAMDTVRRAAHVLGSVTPWQISEVLGGYYMAEELESQRAYERRSR